MCQASVPEAVAIAVALPSRSFKSAWRLRYLGGMAESDSLEHAARRAHSLVQFRFAPLRVPWIPWSANKSRARTLYGGKTSRVIYVDPFADFCKNGEPPCPAALALTLVKELSADTQDAPKGAT